MNDDSNRRLEAILLVLEDQRKLAAKLVEGQNEMRGDINQMRREIVSLNQRMGTVESAVKENTREVSLLRQTIERHDGEIGKIIDVFGKRHFRPTSARSKH